MASPIVRDGQVDLEGRDVRFKLYRVPRRRQVHVMVSNEGHLEVRAPWRFSLEEARVAIHEHGPWILDALRTCRTQVRMRPPLVTGTRLPLLDEQLRLRVDMAAQLSLFAEPPQVIEAAGSVHREDSRLQVRVRSLERSAVRGLLQAWYRAEAARLLPLRMARLADDLGVEYTRVTIRAQRSRWGSCSSSGGISLNWRLILMPARLCDYVLAHELCHLREMNHSPAFWRQVEQLVPDYRERRAALSSVARLLPL